MEDILAIEIPVIREAPDAASAIDALMGRKQLAHPPLVEYIVDESIMRPVLDRMGRTWVDSGADLTGWLDNFAAFFRAMGYSLIKFELVLPFESRHLLAPDTAPFVQRDRSWSDQHHGTISSWAEFESFPWPKVEDFDFSPFEILSQRLPEGMGLMLSHAGGPFEKLSDLMSYEGLCLALYDDLPLVQAIQDKVGELMERFYAHLLDLDHVVALFPGDDMGFRSGTLISPDHLRQLSLPWHKRYSNMAHDHGIPYFLHSCGRLAFIMDDLIDSVGIDGKHSYEDAIIPADEFQAHYGGSEPGSIAVLGGVDLNILAAGTPADVRARTRYLVDTCNARGRYAVGSGNSIPSYIPVENYIAMVQEALK
jgi:uroporphyrinogen decarboxylase